MVHWFLMVFANPRHLSSFQKQVLETSAYKCKCEPSKEKIQQLENFMPPMGIRLRECKPQIGICVQDLFYPEICFMLQLFFQEKK